MAKKKKKKRKKKSAWYDASSDLRSITWGLVVLLGLALLAVYRMGFTAILLLLPIAGIACLRLSSRGVVSDGIGCLLTIFGIIILLISFVFGVCAVLLSGMRLG